MSIVRSEPPTANYSIIRNELITDGSLSMQARMLMVYLLSKPDSWVVNPEHLATIADDSRIPFKRRAVYAALKELREAGYVQMHVIRNAAGIEGYTYTVYDCPQVGEVGPVKEEQVIDVQPEPEALKKKRAKSDKCTFAEFTRLCEEAGEQRVSGDDEVFKELVINHLPDEFIRLHVFWFCRWAESLDKDGRPRKYAGIRGWRQTFRTTVRQNYSRLWYKDDKSGQWCLTTQGRMLMQVMKANGA